MLFEIVLCPFCRAQDLGERFLKLGLCRILYFPSLFLSENHKVEIPHLGGWRHCIFMNISNVSIAALPCTKHRFRVSFKVPCVSIVCRNALRKTSFVLQVFFRTPWPICNPRFYWMYLEFYRIFLPARVTVSVLLPQRQLLPTFQINGFPVSSRPFFPTAYFPNYVIFIYLTYIFKI